MEEDKLHDHIKTCPVCNDGLWNSCPTRKRIGEEEVGWQVKEVRRDERDGKRQGLNMGGSPLCDSYDI